MSNTLPSYGILNLENFANLRQSAARIADYAHNFSAEVANAGTAVSIGYEATGTASLWTAASGYTTTDSTISTRTVTLQEPYHFEIYLSPNEVKSYGDAYLQNRMAAASIPVFDEVKRQALSSLSGSTIGTNVSASNFTFNVVLSASAVVSNAGGQGPQTFLVPRTAFNALLGEAKSSYYQIFNSRDQGGVESFQYALLPNVTIKPEAGLSTAAWMTTPDSVAIGLRLPEQMSGYSRTIFTDTGKTEVAIAVDLLEDFTNGKTKLRAQACVGVATGRPGTTSFVTIP